MAITKPPELQVKKFDIILLSHGHIELLVRCLKTLYAHTATPFHLIIVDDSDVNDPDPANSLVPEYLERFNKLKDNVTYIHSDKPYKEGNQIFNIGLKHAESDFVATIMNSITVEPHWERVALQFMFEHAEVALVGLKCLRPSGLIESAGIAFNKFVPYDIAEGHPSHRFVELYECDAVQWAFAFLRRKAVTGNIHEGIFHGFKGMDDIDNCLVLRKKGYKVFYCGYGCGTHEPRATRGSDAPEDIRLNRENQEIFYHRWGFWKDYQKAGGRKALLPARTWIT